MEEKNQKKLSYEELENVARELSQQNQQLNMMIQKSNMSNAFKRLDYLFKVLECRDCFNSDFIVACSDEIVNIMTIPEEGNTEDSETEKKEE